MVAYAAGEASWDMQGAAHQEWYAMDKHYFNTGSKGMPVITYYNAGNGNWYIAVLRSTHWSAVGCMIYIYGNVVIVDYHYTFLITVLHV